MSVVILHVSCSSAKVASERRFEKGLTIIALKEKLELITGAGAGHMRLQLRAPDGTDVCVMDDNTCMLGAYPVSDHMLLHVIDTNPQARAGQYDDVSQVEKFELTADEYAKRSDTVRAFKMRNKLGRFNPETAAAMEAKAEADAVEGEEKAKDIAVGNRCEVLVQGSGGARRGTVRYVGRPQFSAGWWIGVQYDEPVGKNDGSVKGVSYFNCPNKYGGFVRPAAVTVGDFPEEDLDFGSSSSEGEM